MSVETNTALTWIDTFDPIEQRKVDEIEIGILQRKEEIRLLRAQHNRLRHMGHSRLRRTSNATSK